MSAKHEPKALFDSQVLVLRAQLAEAQVRTERLGGLAAKNVRDRIAELDRACQRSLDAEGTKLAPPVLHASAYLTTTHKGHP